MKDYKSMIEEDEEKAIQTYYSIDNGYLKSWQGIQTKSAVGLLLIVTLGAYYYDEGVALAGSLISVAAFKLGCLYSDYSRKREENKIGMWVGIKDYEKANPGKKVDMPDLGRIFELY